MRTQYTVALSVIAGLALGAATIEVLHAQAKPMAYAIVFNTVNDQEKYLNEFAPAITRPRKPPSPSARSMRTSTTL